MNKLQQEFSEIWDEYHNDIYRYCVVLLNGDKDDAEECVQEVFLSLWKTMQIKSMDNPRVWLYKAAHHTSIRAAQVRSKKNNLVGSLDDQNDFNSYQDELFTTMHSDCDVEAVFKKILKDLSPFERWLLLLYDRKSTKDVCDKLSITPHALDQRYYKLHKKIITMLRDAFNFLSCFILA